MKELFLRFVQSCSPNTYSDLVDEKFFSTLNMWFAHAGILTLLLALLFIPAYFYHADAAAERIGAFTSSRLDGEFSSQGPVVLLSSPRIVFDRNATSIGSNKVLFGKEHVLYKKYLFFGEGKLPYDVFANFTNVDGALAMLAIFLLPAIIFWSSLFLLGKALAFALVAGLLAWLFIGAFKHTLPIKSSFQVALYATMPMLILEFLLFPFYRNFWLSFLIFLFFWLTGVAIVAQRKKR